MIFSSFTFHGRTIFYSILVVPTVYRWNENTNIYILVLLISNITFKPRLSRLYGNSDLAGGLGDKGHYLATATQNII